MNNRESWRDYVNVDPAVCHGKACIKGTRVLVSVILDNVAAGLSMEKIIQSYPSVTRKAILGAISYAAELTREQIVDLPVTQP